MSAKQNRVKASPQQRAGLRRRLNAAWQTCLDAGLLEEGKDGAARITKKGVTVYVVLEAHIRLNEKVGKLMTSQRRVEATVRFIGRKP